MVIGILDTIVVCLLLVLVAFAAIVVRRLVLQRDGGTIQCALRLHSTRRGHAWALGLGRYSADGLQWFRLFSLSHRPRRTFARERLTIASRRAPHAAEAIVLPPGAIVLECRLRTFSGRIREVEIAMSESAVTGFLAWLESVPPGTHRFPGGRPLV